MKRWLLVFSLFTLAAMALEVPPLPDGGKLRLEQPGTVSLSIPLKELRNTQDRIQFRLSGDRKNTAAKLTLTLLLRDREIHSKPFTTNASLRLDLPFGETFQLSDASYAATTLRFTLESKSPAELRIDDLRLGSTDELTASQADFLVSSAFQAPPKRRIPGLEPIRVWFDFDNTDRDTTIRAWPSRNYIPDANPSGGFAALLLDHADGIIEAAPSPEEADVIVYSRARQSEKEWIPGLLAKGKRLIVYGPSPDPELAARLPLAFTERTLAGFAPREQAKMTEPSHPMLLNRKLFATDYGRYHKTRLQTGRALLAFTSGEPLLAEEGNTLHFATGVGAPLLPAGNVFYDKTLLLAAACKNPQALEALERREQEELKASRNQEALLLKQVLPEGANPSGFRTGMSVDNFGRFGWLIGEGLLAGSIGRDLTVENGPQFYRFDNRGERSAALHGWKHKVLSGKITFRKSTPDNSDPVERWNGIGTVEYTAEITIPTEWEKLPLFFEVAGGIDDTDETLFNGVPIGETGEETPRYWEARRAYPIPPDAIRSGKPNEITVRVTNLRGDSGFNSAPRIYSPAPGGGSLRVTETDWVHKRYEIETPGGRQEMILSLLSPFILNRFTTNTMALVLEEKTAQYAAYSTAKGIRVVRLEEKTDFYRSDRDGAWNAPWLLLFRKNWERARPLLLVFEKPVQSLDAELNGRFVSGIRIAAKDPLGTVLSGWPWGSTPVNASKWVEGLPEEALAQIRRSLDFALHFPVGCDEVYRIDREKSEIEIVNRFRYEVTRDAWNTPAKPVASLPPLVGFALEEKQYVVNASPAEALQLNTDYGPLYGARGAERVRYTLPLPLEDDLLPVGVAAEPELRRELNTLFEGGVRWSRGGRVRCEEFTPAYPEGEKRYPEVIGIPLFTWNFGLSVALQGSFMLTPENRLKLAERIRNRYLLPLEQYQYKYIYRNREEPFTGLRYPIVFNHSHPNSTRYAPGIGSPVIIGDNNEGCTMLAWLGRQCADMLGEVNPQRNNWNFIKYGMRNALVLDDYAWHASACREFGGGAYIDMLNGEYAGFLYLAQLARNVGDRAMEDEAFYRAAKRGIPTLMRLRFISYLERALPHIPLGDAAVCTGFAETTFPLMRLPSRNHNFLAANDLFDFSQGFPGSLHRLYERYALPEVSAYLETKALPVLFKDDLLKRDYLPPLFLYADGTIPFREKLDAVLKKESKALMNDWPGIRMAYQGGLYLWRTHDRISIKEFRLLDLRTAEYDPMAKKLRLSFIAREGSRLVLDAGLAVRSVIHNGKTVPPGLTLPTVPGNNEITVEFQ